MTKQPVDGIYDGTHMGLDVIFKCKGEDFYVKMKTSTDTEIPVKVGVSGKSITVTPDTTVLKAKTNAPLSNISKALVSGSFKESLTDLDSLLEKGGKKATDGEVRIWNKNEKWVKHADGWVRVNDETGKHLLKKPGASTTTAATEEHVKHAREHLARHEREQGASKEESNSEVDENKIRGMQKHDDITEEDFHSKIKERFGVKATERKGMNNISDYLHPETKEKLGQYDPEGKHTYIAYTDKYVPPSKKELKEREDAKE